MTCLFKSKRGYISFSHNDDIMFVGKQVLMETKKISDESFNSVSFDCVSRFFGYGYSEPFAPLRVAARYNRKMFRTSPHPLVVNCFKPASFRYPFRFPVCLFLHA